MKTIAKTFRMQKLSNEHLRLGVLAFYAAHIVDSRFLIMHIGHGCKTQVRIVAVGGRSIVLTTVQGATQEKPQTARGALKPNKMNLMIFLQQHKCATQLKVN